MRSIWQGKTTFKMLLASWTFDTIEKGNRSLNAENLKSKDQRASKLLAVKLWKCLDRARVRCLACSYYFQSLTASNFEALWPIDFKFSAFKDLFPFSIVSKVQEAGSILKVVFALSKWPQLHRAIVIVCNQNFIAVNNQNIQNLLRGKNNIIYGWPLATFLAAYAFERW